MKQYNVKALFLILFCGMIAYTGCRKSDNSLVPSKPQPTDTKAVTGQLALNLVKTIKGSFGGANLMDGVDSVQLSGHNAPHHGFNTSALCGFFTDSLVSEDTHEGDTLSHSGGYLSFYFNCQNGKHMGYTAYDSLGTTRTTPKGLFQNYYVKQYYTIECLDDKHQFIGVNGNNYFYQLVNISCGCNNTYADIENSVYYLKDLKIDVCKKDILSGTATFKAYGYNWSVTGTMTFMGNYKADMVINGVTYHCDLQTLTITE